MDEWMNNEFHSLFHECIYVCMHVQYVQRYLTAIRTFFTRWLIRTNSYDLTRTI